MKTDSEYELLKYKQRKNIHSAFGQSLLSSLLSITFLWLLGRVIPNYVHVWLPNILPEYITPTNCGLLVTIIITGTSLFMLSRKEVRYKIIHFWNLIWGWTLSLGQILSASIEPELYPDVLSGVFNLFGSYSIVALALNFAVFLSLPIFLKKFTNQSFNYYTTVNDSRLFPWFKKWFLAFPIMVCFLVSPLVPGMWINAKESLLTVSPGLIHILTFSVINRYNEY